MQRRSPYSFSFCIKSCPAHSREYHCLACTDLFTFGALHSTRQTWCQLLPILNSSCNQSPNETLLYKLRNRNEMDRTTGTISGARAHFSYPQNNRKFSSYTFCLVCVTRFSTSRPLHLINADVNTPETMCRCKLVEGQPHFTMRHQPSHSGAPAGTDSTKIGSGTRLSTMYPRASPPICMSKPQNLRGSTLSIKLSMCGVGKS